MKGKRSLRGPLFITNVIVIIFFVVLIFFVFFGVPDWVVSYAKTIGNATNQSVIIPLNNSGGQTLVRLPVRLSISKLKIDAPIKSVGLTADGAMDVTKGPYDVARYNRGPRPGEIGSAVIAGHYGRWKNGAISVFNTLHTLVSGDIISIQDARGTIISFVVRESKTYPLDADATDVFFSKDGKSHLNLVTCVWDNVTKKYSRRLVVFTDKQ